MQKTRWKQLLLLPVCLCLLAAMTLLITACNPNSPPEIPEENDLQEVGQGSTVFVFSVTGLDGEAVGFKVSTDKTTVGEALLELNLIAGDAGAYGLYVKTVNGETVDYSTHGKYWAFYVNGKLAPTGVDSTTITPDTTYAFRAE